MINTIKGSTRASKRNETLGELVDENLGARAKVSPQLIGIFATKNTYFVDDTDS